MIRRKPLALLLLYQGALGVIFLLAGAPHPAADPAPSPPTPVETGWTVLIDPGYTPEPLPCLPIENRLRIDGCPAVLR